MQYSILEISGPAEKDIDMGDMLFFILPNVYCQLLN